MCTCMEEEEDVGETDEDVDVTHDFQDVESVGIVGAPRKVHLWRRGSDRV